MTAKNIFFQVDKSKDAPFTYTYGKHTVIEVDDSFVVPEGALYSACNVYDRTRVVLHYNNVWTLGSNSNTDIGCLKINGLTWLEIFEECLAEYDLTLESLTQTLDPMHSYSFMIRHPAIHICGQKTLPSIVFDRVYFRRSFKSLSDMINDRHHYSFSAKYCPMRISSVHCYKRRAGPDEHPLRAAPITGLGRAINVGETIYVRYKSNLHTISVQALRKNEIFYHAIGADFNTIELWRYIYSVVKRMRLKRMSLKRIRKYIDSDAFIASCIKYMNTGSDITEEPTDAASNEAESTEVASNEAESTEATEETVDTCIAISDNVEPTSEDVKDNTKSEVIATEPTSWADISDSE